MIDLGFWGLFGLICGNGLGGFGGLRGFDWGLVSLWFLGE